jgi:LysM repeat protein
MKKRTASILLFILLSLALAACTRSASKAPAEVVPTKAAEEQIPFPVNTLAPNDAQPTLEGISPTLAPDGPTEAPLPPESTVQVFQPVEAPTQPVIVVSTPVVPASYVLQQGEFPYCLARRFNIDPGTLLSTNGLNTNSAVSPGTSLTIPTGTTWSGAARERMPHPATYTVKSGDTIYSIACAYGDVFPESIAEANALQAPYALTVGQVLQIP